MKKYKHRLIVDITFNEPIIEKQALLALQEYHRKIDWEGCPAWVHGDVHLYADKVSIKQFSKIKPYLTKEN